MKVNKGHTRCNATGLKYINENIDFDLVVLMDADGEDRPDEIGLLLCKAYEYPNHVITANRVKRSESKAFKFCYVAHKCLTFIFFCHPSNKLPIISGNKAKKSNTKK